jgi:hypothetical protein
MAVHQKKVNLSDQEWTTYFLKCYWELYVKERAQKISHDHIETLKKDWRAALSKQSEHVRLSVLQRIARNKRLKFRLFLSAQPWARTLVRATRFLNAKFKRRVYKNVLHAAGF